MKMLIWILVLVASLGGAFFLIKSLTIGPPHGDLNISVKMAPEDMPEFKRTYKATVDSRAEIEVTMRSYSFESSRSEDGTLTQPNGNYISFDPSNIAEKIIDPVLVPLVEKYVEEIKRMDAAFMASKPSEFTDKKGTVWVRK